MFEYSEDPLGDVLTTPWEGLKSPFEGIPLKVRLEHPLDVISRRPDDVRLGRPLYGRSGQPQDGQIGFLGDVLATSLVHPGIYFCRLGLCR